MQPHGVNIDIKGIFRFSHLLAAMPMLIRFLCARAHAFTCVCVCSRARVHVCTCVCARTREYLKPSIPCAGFPTVTVIVAVLMGVAVADRIGGAQRGGRRRERKRNMSYSHSCPRHTDTRAHTYDNEHARYHPVILSLLHRLPLPTPGRRCTYVCVV